MAQAQHAARGKMIRPMVTLVVIYCVCVWSTVCFSSIEAGPLPHQRQSNMNGTTGNEGTLSDAIIAAIIVSIIGLIGALCAPIITTIVGCKYLQRPSITESPKNIKVAAGQTAELKCKASGKPAPNFQWLIMKDGRDVAVDIDVPVTRGNGHSTLTIKNTKESHAGQYRCRASNLFSCWDDISWPATIAIIGPPTITQNPGAAKVKSGSEAIFTCTASSDLPMKFSWQKSGSGNISSAITDDPSGNSSALTLKPVSTADAGSYTCIVSNDAGSVTSNAANLEITDPPTITQGLKEAKVRSGSEAIFTCAASSDLPMKFSWQKDGSSINSSAITDDPSGNSSTLTLKPVSTADAGSYTCTVSNAVGSVASNAATLQVTDPPTITQDPKETTVRSGSKASFTCVASSDLPIKFSWQKEGSGTIFSSPITAADPSGNTSTLTLKHVSTTDAGSYTCTASNDAGSVTSNAATLQVTDPLSVYVDKLKQVYRAPPPTWNPLPKCGHIKLAMIREKGMRRGEADETVVRHQVKGEVEAIVASRVSIEVDRIFDSGLFDEEHQVILVEGPPGGGKTSLTYHYSQEWAAGNLSMFDVVAVVHLRTLDATKTITLPDLLLLACASGNDKEITKDMIQQYVLKCSRLLLVLDGWDEAPNQLRKPSFVTKILQSIMPQCKLKILITSRPESSVDLHGLANRVEIVGFTKKSIYEYFQRALSTELDHDKVEDGCRKLREHFRNHPVIQSCCSIPLNAAILAHLFLTDQSLPSTRHELFHMLVLSRINKELQERYSQRNVTVLSLDDLPHEHKTTLSHICVLAFEGVKQNKVVFPQEELVRLKLPLDLPALGLLQIVECYGRLGQTSYCYFIHLSIQELLAAYHISQLREDEQVKVFQNLLDEPRFSSVLQFYAAFTRFTNQGVRDIITGIDLANKKHILLTIMRCCFEAEIHDKLLYYQVINQRLNGTLGIFDVVLAPFDCMSVGYFLAFALRAGKLHVNLKNCNIDDHSLGLLLSELSRHDKACPAGVLQGVTELDFSSNEIGDDGIVCLATALQANTTMKSLYISNNRGITNNGAKSLGSALSVNSSLEKLVISHTGIGDEGVAHIANALQVNTTMKVLIVPDYYSITVNGAKSLGRALSVNSSIEELDISRTSIGDEGVAHIAHALQRNATMKVLKVSNCDISCNGAESLARALSVNSSLEELNISFSSIGDEGVAHIANALQTNTTMKALEVSGCDISDKGAESLARALAASSSLERLDISLNSIGDDGIAHIACALQTLKSLMLYNEFVSIFYKILIATDKAALSLAAALTTNISMEVTTLIWISTHPVTTLQKMAECIKKSILRGLQLHIVIPQPLHDSQVSLEEVREWYRHLEVGGKEFILSLEDSRLESLLLAHNILKSYTHDTKSQIQMSLKRAATSVNLKRKMNHLPEIKFFIYI